MALRVEDLIHTPKITTYRSQKKATVMVEEQSTEGKGLKLKQDQRIQE